jgi:hypothetical protein
MASPQRTWLSSGLSGERRPGGQRTFGAPSRQFGADRAAALWVGNSRIPLLRRWPAHVRAASIGRPRCCLGEPSATVRPLGARVGWRSLTSRTAVVRPLSVPELVHDLLHRGDLLGQDLLPRRGDLIRAAAPGGGQRPDPAAAFQPGKRAVQGARRCPRPRAPLDRSGAHPPSCQHDRARSGLVARFLSSAQVWLRQRAADPHQPAAGYRLIGPGAGRRDGRAASIA